MAEKKLGKTKAKQLSSLESSLADALSEHEKAVQSGDLNDIKKTLDKLNEANTNVDEFLKENSNFKDQLDTMGDDKSSSVDKSIVIKILKLLATVGTLVGFFLVLKHYLDSKSGCMKYEGGEGTKTKIDCPDSDNKDKCICVGDGPESSSAADVNTFCNKSKDNNDYPYCCNRSNPPCSGIPGKENSVYYSWLDYGIPDFFHDAMNLPGQIAKEGLGIFDGFLDSLKKFFSGGILIALGLLFGFLVLYIIIKKIFKI